MGTMDFFLYFEYFKNQFIKLMEYIDSPKWIIFQDGLIKYFKNYFVNLVAVIFPE